MSGTELDKVDQKVLAIVDRLTKKNQLIRTKELFAIAKRELNFPKIDIEKSIWKLISMKYIVDGAKLTKDTVLENQNRQEILKLIFDAPGVHIRDVRTKMNMGSYLTSWHLKMLEKFGLVRKKPYKNRIRLFPYLLREEDEEAYEILKDETLFEVNEFIFGKETVTLQDVVENFNIEEQTAQAYVDTLLSVNLIDFKEEQGTQIYWGNDEQLKPVLEFWQQKNEELQKLIPEEPPAPVPPVKKLITPIPDLGAPQLVEAKREYDYLGGNIRFKIAVRNNSETVVSKVRVMLTPTDQFNFEADVKSIETLAPGESRGIDFLLTPLTCGKSQVFGTISYVNAYGKPNSFTVNPKEIWVKCPLVTSIKAEMKELLKWQSELQSGMSSISFEGLTRQTAFAIVSDQISALDLAIVSLEKTQLKSIYSGIAKVTNTKIIVELETYEDAVKLVVWASDLKQVTGFLAYIKNLVNIALGMSKTLRIKEEKLGEKLLSAFEFVERLIQLFEYCEQNWALDDIVILLKEIVRRIQRDLSGLSTDINQWITDFEKDLTPEACLSEQSAINLEYETFEYLNKVSDHIKSNLEMYKSAYPDDTKIVPMIEEKHQHLSTIITKVEQSYSKRILAFLLIIENNSGLTLFQHNFSEKEIDPDLISGFLTAVQSFGIELTAEETEMKKLAYKNFEIELNIGDYIRAALFLKGQSTKYQIKNLVTFINDFERKYEEALKEWHGDISIFKDATQFVEKIFGK